METETGRTAQGQIFKNRTMAYDSSRQITAGRKPGRAVRYFLLILAGIFAVILLVGQEPGETTTPMMQADPITDLSGTWTLRGKTCVTQLPADLPRGSLLQLSSIEDAYTVYVDGEEIFRVEPDNAATAFQWIPLPEDSAGRTLQIRGEAAEETLEALNASSLLGTQAALQRRLMASNFYALLFFLFCVFVAAFLLYASIQQRRRQVDPSLSTGALGLFLLCAGIWALTDSQILQLVTARVNLGAMVSVICFFLMPVFFLQFLGTLLPNVRVIRILELLFLGNMALGLFLHLVGVVSVYGYMLSNHLLLLVMMLLVLRHLSKDREPSHRKIRTGCFAYFVCEIAGLSAYYLAPTSRWYARILSLGVLVLSLFCLAAWFNRYQEDLNRIAQNELFKKLAYRDSLTGLGNRAAYERDRLQVAPGEDIALVMFDINGLKAANDTYGHAVGDQLIRAAAGQIQEAFGEDGTVYRMGGDEFLAMVTGKAAAEMDRFDRIIQKRLEGSLTIEHGIPVRAAWGAASTKKAPAAELFHLADQRMYEKKRQMKQNTG